MARSPNALCLLACQLLLVVSATADCTRKWAAGSSTTSGASADLPASSRILGAARRRAQAANILAGHDVDGMHSGSRGRSLAQAAPSSTPTQVPPMLQTTSPTCQPSPWGYACARKLSQGAVLHYSLGGPIPSTLCAGGAVNLNGTALPDGWGVLHLALEGATTGYISLGFPGNPGYMSPSVSIISMVDDANPRAAPQATFFNINSYSLSGNDAMRTPPSWSLYTGVVQTQDGRTFTCFGRPARLSAQGAGGGAASGAGGVSSTITVGQVEGLDATQAVQFIWALGAPGEDGLTRHASEGAFSLVLADPQAPLTSVVPDELKNWILVHAACLVTAWAGLAPLGVLLARHRWMLEKGPKLPGGLPAIWFVAHVSVAWGVVALTVTGFTIAYTQFPRAKDVSGKENLQAAHHVLGIIVVALMGLQVLLAHTLRPVVGAPRRAAWNLVHWWTGRTTLLVAWATLITGAVVFNQRRGASLALWLAVAVAPPAVMVLLSGLLDLRRPKVDSAPGPIKVAGAGPDPSPGLEPHLDVKVHVQSAVN